MAVSVFFSSSIRASQFFLSFSFFVLLVRVCDFLVVSEQQATEKENRTEADGWRRRSVFRTDILAGLAVAQFQILVSSLLPSSPTHPGHGVAQSLKKHHARADPGALEKRGGGGAEGDGGFVGGGCRVLAPQRNADGQRRQHLEEWQNGRERASERARAVARSETPSRSDRRTSARRGEKSELARTRRSKKRKKKKNSK